MKADVFVNLCVQDVKRSRSFFEKLGFEIKEEYSDDTGYCLSINERAYAMMLGLEKYMLFSKNTVVDSFKHTESIFSLDLKTPEKVDEILEKVKKLGGSEIGKASDDEYMYYRSFRDLDGHHFEVFAMKKQG
ncbi:MAG: glyoxalase/bleomycin resistance/extradiol dioxygenase family protein [Tenericutes bacterium HGW-Tenericutes-2]|nr:MAG: glyoxalase/bleomycin resistance/extradiol dioxygenase family protein [Tenericutes bacterium HGW-Tenericutes-2]